MGNKQKNGQISLDDYKEIIKEMLRDFHAICMKKHLRYYVAFGTLLGAIRHNGFIPWDDDIDVCMPRSDYEKLLQSENLLGEDYYLISPANSKYYYNNFSRFCSRKGKLVLKGVVNIDNLGPFIDIFPLDAVTENSDERAEYYRTIRDYYVKIRYSLPFRYFKTLPLMGRIKMNFNIPRKLYLRYNIGTEKLKRQREQYITKYNSLNTGIYCTTFDKQTDELLVYEEEIKQLIPHKYEDLEVLIPTGYDAVLTRLYGDYMKLPPEEARVSNHHFIPFWK